MFGFGKKKLQSSPADLDFSEFEDFDFEDLDSEDDSRNVTLTSRLKGGIKDELDYKRQDAKFKRDLLKQSLPSDYTPVLESYDTVSNEVGKLWRDQQKEWQRVRKDVKTAIQPFGDVASKLGFKKLKQWAEEPEVSRGADVSEEQMDELKVHAILQETFGEFAQQQTQAAAVKQEIDDDRYAADQADKEQSAERQLQGNKLLAGINKGLAAQRSYNEQVTYAYQRKSIEFQARSLIAQQRSLTVLNAYRQESMKELQAIHKNTGLPDYLKINSSEIAQQVLTQKVMNGIMAPFDGVGGKLMTRVVGKIRTKMKDFWTFAGEGLSMLNDSNRDTVDSGGSVLGNYGNILQSTLLGGLVDKGVGKVTGYLTPKIREQMEKRGWDIYGSNLSSLSSQLPTLANKGLKSGFNNALLDGVVDFLGLRDAAITGDRTAFNAKDLDLEKAAFMDNRFRLTVIDIIPAWLKKIYQATYKTAYRKDPTDLVWDFKSGSFVSSEKVHDEAMDRIVKKENVVNSVEAVNEWLKVLDPNQVMSIKTRNWVKKWVLKERAGSDAMHPLELLSPSVNAPQDVKAELLFVIPVLLGLSEKDKDAIMNADGVTDLMRMSLRNNRTYNKTMSKLADASVKIRSTSVLDEKEIERQAQTAEGRQFLIKAGIIIPSPDGQSYFINPDFEHKAFGTYGSKYKRNGRVVNDDGKLITEAIDEDYDPSSEKMQLQNRLNYGSMHKSAALKSHERLRELQQAHQNKLAFDDLVLGDDYLILPNGEIIGVDDPRYEKVRKRVEGTKKFNSFSLTGLNHIRPLDVRQSVRQKAASIARQQIFGKRTFASGGQIPSFAKGGPTAQVQPDQEQLVKTHGGEFVVSKDATDFNKSLLSAINKIGAPLINNDNTINSAYYKLFGFKSEKEFKAGAKLKGLTSKAREFANEQKETAIRKIWENLDIRAGNFTREEMNSVLDKKLTTERRLTNAMKLWTKQQQSQARNNPQAYAKNLGRMGINSLHRKFNQFIDPNNEGTNVEIMNQLGRIGHKVGSDALRTGRNLAGRGLGAGADILNNARGKMLDRDRTMLAVSTTLKETENPKMFNLPIDLYFKGRGTPFVTKQGFKNHEYIDQNTGAIIKNPSEITGTIVDKDGSVIATLADMGSNEIVTRAGKPYRLLGLEEANRRYQSATEYAGKRYALIAQSEKFQDLLEKGKQARDRFVLDKPIDIYSRDKKLLLTAQGFKDRRYMDKETGNVLWSHHDITGTVVDLQDNGNVVLSEEQLKDGLFDAQGEHVKISKIKQYRNMAFKRTGEVYNQYAAKHINKVRDKALNMMSAMGEKRVGLNHDKNPVDVYVVGETEPRVTAADFKAGKVFCQDKPIKSHSGISGAVMMVNQHGMFVKISTEELSNLCDAMGNKLELPLMMSSTQRFGAYVKEAFLPSAKLKSMMSFLKMSKDKRKEVLDGQIQKMGIAFDVYVKGSPEKPVLTKKGFENNQYISMKTGKPIIVPEYIDGPVLDTSGKVILSDEEIKKGLVTYDGRSVKIGFDPLNGGLFANMRSSLNISRRMAVETARLKATTIEDVHIKGEKDPILKAIDIKAGKYFRADNGKPVKEYSDILAGVKDVNGNTVVSEKDLKTGLVTSSGKSIQSLAKVKGALKNIANLFRVGSWQSQRDNKAGEKKEDKKDKDGKKEKKDSWIGKLIKAFMSPLGVMLGGVLTGIKGIFNTGIGWLGKTLAAKMAGSALGGMLGGLGGVGGRGAGGLLSKLGWRGKLALGAMAGYGAYKGYQYLDGNSESPDSQEFDIHKWNQDRLKASRPDLYDPTMGAMASANPQDLNTQPEEKGGVWNTIKEYAPEAALTGAMFFPRQTAKLLGRGAMAGVRGFGKGVDFVAKQGLRGTAWGAGKLASKLPGMGRLAMGAGRLAAMAGAGTWGATGAIGGAALNLGRILFTGARLLTPWGLGLTAAYFAGKGLLKLWNNHKNPWNRFRMAQYGFNHNDKALMEKIGQIESAAQSLIAISGRGVVMKNDEKAMNEILRICGFKDENGQDIPDEQQRLPMFAIWFKERFMRVFASYAETLKKITGKPDMIDLQKLDRDQQEQLLKGVHFLNAQESPYMIMQSPFKDPSSCEMDFNDVDKIGRKLRDKISQLPKPEKKARAPSGKDGLDEKLDIGKAGKSDADKAVEKEINTDEVVGQVKKDVGDPKNMTDAAVKAVKYNSLATQALTKQHQDAMLKTTEQAAKQTDGIFSKLWNSFSDKIKNFQSAAAAAYAKITNGTVGGVVDGVGDVVGMMPGANAIYSLGQSAADMLGMGSGSGAKTAEKNLIQKAFQVGITDPNEIAMLLAQTSHESGGFKHSRELGNDAYFAKYNNRKDLGNGPSDGAKYKGRGWIQVTGKANYAAFSKWAGVDVVSKPELLEKEPYASMAAIWYWTQHPNMARRGRKAAMGGDIVEATKAINGGTKGLDDRKQRFAKYKALIKNDPQKYLASLGGVSTDEGVKSPNKDNNTPLLIAAGRGVAEPKLNQLSGGGIVAGATASMNAKLGGNAPVSPPATPSVAGNPIGQRASGVVTAKASGNADWDIDKIVATAASRAGVKSQGKCATYVRQALQAGDLKKQIKGGLGHAYQYAQALPQIGFVPVGNINSVRPQKGDICVFPRYGSNSGGGAAYGHVCIFTGTQWVSDFVQRTMFPNSSNKSLPHTIYRAQHGISRTGAVTAKAIPDGSGVDDRMAQPTSVANSIKLPAAKNSVNQVMRDINDGSMSTTTMSNQTYQQPQPDATPLKETNAILSKQLNVQERILEILEKVVTGKTSVGFGNNTQGGNNNQPTVTPGVSTPDLSNVGQPRSAPVSPQPSPFRGVTDPVSVRKPI